MWFILYFSVGFVMSIITYVCAKLYDMYEYKYLGQASYGSKGDAEYGRVVFSILWIFAWPIFLLVVACVGFYYVLNLLTQKLFSVLETALLKKDK